MDVGDLKVFAAVAEAGVVTRAAVQLNTVQSNVTARLHALEEELGVALFHRHSRGMSLTSAGVQLQRYAARILALVDEAKSAVSDTGEPRGVLRLGSMETTAAIRMPTLLVRYAEQFPLVDLNLQTGVTEQLIQDVLDRKLDGAFVAGPVVQGELESILAFEEEMTVATSINAGSLDRLISTCPEMKILVFRQGCVYRKKLETFLRDRGAAKIKVLEFGTLEGILGCVAAGVGITMLPVSVVNSGAGLASHVLPKDEALIQTVFVSRTASHADASLVRFRELVEENASRDVRPKSKATRLKAVK
jgi:LysR family transcriptional regulator, cell division regulator